MHGWRILGVGALVALLGVATAHAQTSTIVKYNEGPGVRLGEALVLHPGVGVATMYDTNVFYNATDENPQGAPYLAALFHLDLATLSPQRTEGQPAAPRVADFRLRFGGAYRNYFTDNRFITDQNNVDLDGSLNATFNPGGWISFRVSDDYVRTSQARNMEGPGSFVRDYNRAGAQLGVSPGGGMLNFALGYNFYVDHFENGWSYASINPDLMTHEFTLQAGWRFLPKTAVNLWLSQGITSRDLVLGGQRHPDSYPFRVELGLIGQLTYKLQAMLRAGYGNGFYQSVAGAPSGNFNSVIGTAQLKWLIDPTATVTVGYNRNFQDSLFGDSYTDDHFFARYDQLLFGRVVLNVAGGFRYRQYNGLDPRVWTIGSRSDALVDAQAGADFRIKDWLFAGVAYNLLLDSTSARPAFISGPGAAPLVDNPSYTKHLVSARVEVAY
jgi:hypothetical protein